MRDLLRFLAGCLLYGCVADAPAQSTGFTYQGQLLDHGAAANGTYDFRFTLHDADSGGSQVGGNIEKTATTVTHGLFAVGLDFGAGAFPGADRWLEIAVRTNGAPSYTTLGGRQSVGTVPYAQRALKAGSADTAMTATTANTATTATTAGHAATADSATTAITASNALNADTSASAATAAFATTAGTATTVSGPVPAAQVTGTFSLSGTVANSATTATSLNQPDTIVSRDGSGNFAAGTVTATAFAGGGAGLTGLNASALATGTVPLERLPASVQNPVFSGPFVGDGSQLTDLSAGAVTFGTGGVYVWGPGMEFGPVQGWSNVGRIAVGPFGDAYAVLGSGQVATWNPFNALFPELVPQLTDVVQVYPLQDSLLTVQSDGSVRELWWEDSEDAGVAMEVYSPANTNEEARSVAVLQSWLYVLQADGHLRRLPWGEVPDGEFPGSELIPGILDGRSLSCGMQHCLVLRAGGAVSAFGGDSYGETSVPSLPRPALAVVAGNFVSLALLDDGSLVQWGNIGDVLPPPEGLGRVIAIAADTGLEGNTELLALLENGSVVRWGGEGSGSELPSQAGGLSRIGAGGGVIFGWRESTPSRVPDLASDNAFIGEVSALAFVGDGSRLTGLNASSLTSGILDGNLVGDLDAGSIVSGLLSAARIPSLDAGKVTTGAFHADRIPGLDASKITTGVLAAERIPGLDAGKITSGSISAAGRVANSATTATSANTASAIVARNASGAFSAGAISASSFAGVGTALTDLNAANVTQGELPDARLSSNIPRLNQPMTVTADLRLSDNDIFFRGGTDANHGLGWFGGARLFAGADVNGPILYGWQGGALGSINGGTQRIALRWDQGNTVHLNGPVLMHDSMALDNQDGSMPASMTGSVTDATGEAVMLVKNASKDLASAPTLKVYSHGESQDGALMVTAEAGRIATFHKFGSMVAYLENNGTWRASSYVITSDRNQKAGFESVDPEAILSKLAAIPVQRWHFTNDVAATPHVGPMAQDFHAAFGVGADDKGIATVDADGVAFASIQALHRRSENLADENAALREKVDRLATLVEALARRASGGE